MVQNAYDNTNNSRAYEMYYTAEFLNAFCRIQTNEKEEHQDTQNSIKYRDIIWRKTNFQKRIKPFIKG